MRARPAFSILIQAVVFLLPGVGAQAQEPLVLEPSGPLALGSGETSVRIFNDTPTSFDSLLVLATLDTLSLVVMTSGSDGVAEPFQSRPLAPGASLSVGVVRPDGVVGPMAGMLWVRAFGSGALAAARARLSVPGPLVHPAITSWTVESRQRLPLSRSGGDLGRPLPTVGQGDCVYLETQTLLVDENRSVELSAHCDPNGLQLRVGSFEGVGRYSGVIRPGGSDITIEVLRRLHWGWAILAIVFGLVIALFVQSLIDQTWRWEGSRFLWRLERRAKKADKSRRPSPADPWHQIRLLPAIRAEIKEIKAEIGLVVRKRKGLLRYLPWPPELDRKERRAIQESIRDAGQLLSEWGPAPDDGSRRPGTWKQYEEASRLLEEEKLLLKAVTPAMAAKLERITGRRTADSALARHILAELRQVQSVAKAIRAAADSVQLRAATLQYPWPPPMGWSGLDVRTLARAEQIEREVRRQLAVEEDARVVAGQVYQRIQRGLALVARLPDPSIRVLLQRTTPYGPHDARGFGTAGMAKAATTRKGAGLLDWTRVRSALRGRVMALTTASIIVATAFVGLSSGLATLYMGKPWGSPVDFVYAVAWGLGASAVIGPIGAAVRRVGLRAEDVLDE